MLRHGDAAPDFVLRDTHDEDVRLSSLGGRPLLVTFLPPGVPGSRGVMASFLQRADVYKQSDAHIVRVCLGEHDGVEADDFTTVIDAEGRVHDLYEAWRTTIFGRQPWAVRRCSYLIDADGIIRRVYSTVNVFRHARQVVKDLDRLAAQKAWGAKPGKQD